MTVICCMNLPKTDWGFGTCDAYVKIKYNGNLFETKIAKNSYDPYFRETFSLPIVQVKDPGRIIFNVLDWDRFTKDDGVGACEISSLALAEMCKGYQFSKVLSIVSHIGLYVLRARALTVQTY